MAETSLGKRMKTTMRLIGLSIKRMFFQEILVLGDSHARLFNSREIRNGFRRSFFNVVAIPGATASGILNPSSKTQAYPLFKKALNQSRARQVVVMLGEVDTGFVIWYRAQKYGESIQAMLERAVQCYSDFLTELTGAGCRIICISTPLPTIPDDAARGDVAKARREVTATQQERTELTLEFNQRISAVCTLLGALFVDLDPESLGPDGLVRRDLLNHDPADHHYSLLAHSRLIMPHLLKVLEK